MSSPIDIDRLIYEAVAAERKRCSEKCQLIMRRHMDAGDRKHTVEERSAEIAQALGAAECRGALSPYVVGNGLYCDEVARFVTFDEALEHYRKLPTPRRAEWRAIGIWNEDECDGATDGNPDGLTDEEREQL